MPNMDTTGEVLRAATLDLASTLDLDAVLPKLLEHLAHLVSYDSASLMLLEDDGRLVVRAAHGYERWGDPGVVVGYAFDPELHPVLGRLIEARASQLLPDTRRHAGWQRHPGAHHVLSWLGVPLLDSGEVIGVYSVDKAVAGFFGPEQVRLTEALVPHATMAIQNARLFERVQRSEERFRVLFEHSSEAVVLLDQQGDFTYGSEAARGLLGADLLGRNCFALLHPDDLPRSRALFARVLRSPGEPVQAEVRMRHPDGTWRHVSAVGVNHLEDPAVRSIVVNFRDVTEADAARQRIEGLNRDLRRQLAEFRTLLDVIPIGIGIAHDAACRRIDANPCLQRMLSVPPGGNASFSAPDGELSAEVRLWRNGRPLDPPDLPMQRAAERGEVVLDFEMELRRGDARVGTILGYAAPLFDEAGRPRGAIGASLDISERKLHEEQVHALAYNDALSGLPNRLLFQDRLAMAVAQAHRAGQRLGVLFIDLDRFKEINDSLGHTLGDRLIHGVAQRLRQCVREGDTVARLGGDEFTLLLPDLGQAVDAARVAEKVLEVVRAPFHLDGHDLFVTASLGISLYPDDGRDPETLLKNADTAMYRAKEQGRDTFKLYAADMNARALERLALESSLRKALANDEFVLHYQPITDLNLGRVHGVEALLRWQHPERGLVEPGEFVGLAEVTGLILPIGSWVLRTACAQARAWQRQGLDRLSVSVNLSARQFQQPDLAQQVRQALDESGLPPRFLELEITESNAMLSPETTAATLQELKGLGVRVSIDDFGTGYSSLSLLRRLPIDTLKVDQSFIRGIPAVSDDAAIATTIISLGRLLNLDVVAEGVETQEQLRFLAFQGCHRAQGHLISRPLPAHACTAWLIDSLRPA